jgi:succinate dehydrogenase flavin-adding protein (antitoxin of CptAB toxin-antitoxin module)
MNITNEQEPIQNEDSVLMAVMAKYWERSRIGKQKYGTNLDREDYNLIDWLTEAQEEAMDLSLYLEAAIKKIKENGR